MILLFVWLRLVCFSLCLKSFGFVLFVFSFAFVFCDFVLRLCVLTLDCDCLFVSFGNGYLYVGLEVDCFSVNDFTGCCLLAGLFALVLACGDFYFEWVFCFCFSGLLLLDRLWLILCFGDFAYLCWCLIVRLCVTVCGILFVRYCLFGVFVLWCFINLFTYCLSDYGWLLGVAVFGCCVGLVVVLDLCVLVNRVGYIRPFCYLFVCCCLLCCLLVVIVVCWLFALEFG